MIIRCQLRYFIVRFLFITSQRFISSIIITSMRCISDVRIFPEHFSWIIDSTHLSISQWVNCEVNRLKKSTHVIIKFPEFKPKHVADLFQSMDHFRLVYNRQVNVSKMKFTLTIGFFVIAISAQVFAHDDRKWNYILF